MLHLNAKEALKLGIVTPQPTKNLHRRQRITAQLARIHAAQCQVQQQKTGIELHIIGLGLPSLNEVLRWDVKREFPSYNKAWHRLIHDAVFLSKTRPLQLQAHESVHLYIHSIRPRLLDMDNLCAKQLIDGIVHSGLIPDDSPRFIHAYTVTQQQAKRGETHHINITMKIENIE
ncbi:MAG: hypothetical protein R8M38_07255 [Mariprofundaceae bacterium]